MAYQHTPWFLVPKTPAILPSGRPAGNRKAAPMWLPTQWMTTYEQHTKKHPSAPTPNTGTAGAEGAQTEESLRHNGLLSLPTAANPDTTRNKACLSDAAAATE